MTSPTTLTCRGCGYAELPVSQYECPKCRKPNLKGIIPGALQSGIGIWTIGAGVFGLLAVASLIQAIVVLSR
jgi:hypothetical protein